MEWGELRVKWRNYGQVTRPDGEWVRTTDMISVIGIHENMAGFRDFCAAAEAAHKRGLRFGVDIAADPENDLTENALLVIGVAQSKGFFGGIKAHQWRLGHVWHEIADELHRDLVSRDVSIASELLSIYPDPEDPQIKIAILAPKGHSKVKREAARARRLVDKHYPS